MRKLSKTLITCAMISAGCTAQLAIADAGQFYVAPGIQAMNFDNSLPVHNDEGWFLGLGYDFTDRISAELSSFDLDPKFTSRAGGNDIDLDHYKVDLLFDLNDADGIVDPFIVSGLGNVNFGGDNDTVWDLGAGVRVKLSENLTWRTAIRNYTYFGRDHEDSDIGMDTALVWRFGGESNARRRTPTPTPVVNTPAVNPVPTPTVVVDSDGDGVPDDSDLCPDTPANYAVDASGCPITVEEVARVELEVNFELNRAVVRPQFYSEIENVADFMSQYPDVVVELEGHTDSTGAEDYNLNLSQRRADAVRQELIDQFNIQGSRVTARGFGESQPVATNATAVGRAANRRVITVILQTVQSFQPR